VAPKSDRVAFAKELSIVQLIGDAIVLSATDLNNSLACEHLTTLDLAVLRKELSRPQERPGQAILLAELGEQHERTYLEILRGQGHDVVTIDRSRGIEAAVEATERAMREGASIVYQATFFDGTWLGYADFLRRTDEVREGAKWPWHYEVEDTKLARHTEPYFLLQLSYYSEHAQRVQGVAPRFMYVVLGDGMRHRFRVDDFAAYYRSVKERFLHRLHDGADTYPVPVSHCNLCAWNPTFE
jgi:predicted RecB family nuclease